MWKLIIGFVLFAAFGIYMLTKSGGDIDLGGEKHDTGSHSTPHKDEPKK